MSHRYSRHYTREEARALLPEIRAWLAKLRLLQPILEQHQHGVGSLLEQGHDIGGERVGSWMRSWLTARQVTAELRRRQIQIRNLERGLVDFPALRGDKEVFLCWEEGEPDVEYWHELDTGFTGRSPV